MAKANGELVPVPIPTASDPKVLSMIPSNLGFVIKSERLLELKSVFDELHQKFLAKQSNK
ncbi:hypothetical protein ACUN24_00890 [Pedobacter sp. WC2501]|uniref:hypothetical protein n=1 Tax=Pedobacter sp. WC2501 TaxID=3461400 RepID=UPI0040465913